MRRDAAPTPAAVTAEGKAFVFGASTKGSPSTGGSAGGFVFSSPSDDDGGSERHRCADHADNEEGGPADAPAAIGVAAV